MGVILHNLALLVWIGAIWAVAGVPGLVIYAARSSPPAASACSWCSCSNNFEDTCGTGNPT